MNRWSGSFWAAEWRSVNRLDGERRHVIYEQSERGTFPALFRTRRECRAFIKAKFDYIRERPDLRAEPHGWHVPQAVLVTVVRVPADRR
jgi:hypothetical protein